MRLLRDADHALSDARARVSSRLRGEVILLGVDDDAATDDGRLATAEREILHHQFVVGISGRIGTEVAEITRMTVFGFRTSVHVTIRVVVTSRCRTVLGAGIAEFVDVDGVLRIRGQTGDVGDNAHAGWYGGESNDSLGDVALGWLDDCDQGFRHLALHRLGAGSAMVVGAGGSSRSRSTMVVGILG